MKAFFFTFAHVFLSAFLLSPLIFAKIPFGIREFSLPIEDVHEESLVKRGSGGGSTHSYAYKWPKIDGDLHHMPAEKYFKTAYWTFNGTFLHKLKNLAKHNPNQAKELLFKASMEYNIILRNQCWKISNSSAKAHHRINTLARVASFPNDNPKANIDPIYNLVAIVKVACFERSKGGNVNIPIKIHNKKLIKSLGWDKETALRKVNKMHKQFTPEKKVKN